MKRIMKKIILFLLFAVAMQTGFAQLDFKGGRKFTHADTLRGKLTPFRSCYDVLLYDLDVRVDIDKKYISGSNGIKFLVVSDCKQIQVDLFANMKVEKIEYNGQALPYMRDGNAVFITFPDILRKGSVQRINFYYSGNPQIAKHAPWDGGFSWSMDGDSPFVGVSCQGTGASLWWPCKDHQSDEPEEMLIRVTAPPGLDEVSNGRLLRKTALPDGWNKFEWHVSYPINNYDVTLNIAKYKHFSDKYVNPDPAYVHDTLTLDYFVLPSNYEKAQKQFAQVKPMMDCFYKYFGEYPFVRDGYKLVEAPYLGMEHQSCVEYGNKYHNGYLGRDLTNTGIGTQFDFIIIHESAHEWWGNSITTNDVADMWVHEGFGSYAEALYVECRYGHDAYLQYINGEKGGVANDKPITGPYEVNEEGSEDMYQKGALMIHTIRSIISDDEKFFRILRGLQEEFRYKTINATDVEQYISDNAGIDLSEVFNQYLKKTEIPTLQIYGQTLNNGDLKITYNFKLPENSTFSMPVLITTEKDKYGFIFPSARPQSMILEDMKPDDLIVATELFYIKLEMGGPAFFDK